MGFDINKKGEHVKIEEFVKEMKDRYKEAKIALIKFQEEMKRYADRIRKEAEEYRVGNKVLISTKDFLIELMKRSMKKLMEKYIGPCVVKKIISENAVELEFLVLLRIHQVVNVRRIVKYYEQVEGQKKIPPPLVEIEKILDRRERRGKPKYLVRWKGYIAKENTWEGLENLKNAMGLVEEFEKEIREEEIQQVEKKKEKQKITKIELNSKVEEFKRSELLGKYMVRILFGWNDNKFENKYLKKLERNWAR